MTLTLVLPLPLTLTRCVARLRHSFLGNIGYNKTKPSSRLCLLGSVFSALSSRLGLLGSVFSALSSQLCLLGSVFLALSSQPQPGPTKKKRECAPPNLKPLTLTYLAPTYLLSYYEYSLLGLGLGLRLVLGLVLRFDLANITDKAREDKTTQHKTRQDKTTQDNATQDKTRQHKTRQDSTR